MRKPWYHILYTRSPLAKIVWGVAGAMLSVVLTIFQFSIEEPRMKAQEGNWTGRSIEKGAELFDSNCSNCHGADGKGLPNVAPALNSKYFFTQRTVDVGWAGTLHDFVELTVAGGRPSKAGAQWAQMMPTWSNHFGGPLREDQVLHVVNFVMNWEGDAKKQSAADDPFQCFRGVPTKAQEGDKSPDALGIKTCTADGIAVMPGEAPPTPTPAAAVTGPRPPQQLFTAMGCSGCHKLDQDQTDDNIGQPGPNMRNLPETAGQRVPGQDAATYVHTSIVDPNAFLSPGSYVGGIMPGNFKDQMSAEEIDSLVAWVLDPNRPQ